MAQYIPAITVGIDTLEAQLKAANNRIIRANRLKMDNEYAEGVRDTLAWMLGRGLVPFASDESLSEEVVL